MISRESVFRLESLGFLAVLTAVLVGFLVFYKGNEPEVDLSTSDQVVDEEISQIPEDRFNNFSFEVPEGFVRSDVADDSTSNLPSSALYTNTSTQDDSIDSIYIILFDKSVSEVVSESTLDSTEDYLKSYQTTFGENESNLGVTQKYSKDENNHYLQQSFSNKFQSSEVFTNRVIVMNEASDLQIHVGTTGDQPTTDNSLLVQVAQSIKGN